MRNFLSAFSVLVALVCAIVLVGCSEPNGEGDGALSRTDVTLLESETHVVFRAETTRLDASLFDAMQLLQGVEFSFTYEVGDYGAQILTVNGVAPADRQFWAIYTSLTEYDGVSYSSTEFGSYEYGDLTLGSASYGCSSLPLVEGAIYVIALGSY